jgi:predicted dinucleotide-binding enzyme
MVGETIASKLTAFGHDVCMGSRTADNPKAITWAQRPRAQAGTFAQAAAFGEAVFNCTNGKHSLDVLRAAGEDAIGTKLLIDVANEIPANPSQIKSLGERIQEAFPRARVVKTLNTINCDVMVDPTVLAGSHSLFMSGNDADAKASASKLLESLGWVDIIDLGGIETARATEAYLALWLALYKKFQNPHFNILVIR